ncbi:hypothetical protein ACQ86N_05470 [Puia sp. P3]|uniref:hypothetical protein n=1 Tax=Puia sp. P3 TaxID=3423952 RepID=UPI003D66934A
MDATIISKALFERGPRLQRSVLASFSILGNRHIGFDRLHFAQKTYLTFQVRFRSITKINYLIRADELLADRKVGNRNTRAIQNKRNAAEIRMLPYKTGKLLYLLNPKPGLADDNLGYEVLLGIQVP